MPAAAPLPIQELRSSILHAIGSGNRLILQAPTGSGKSTQVPQFLLEADLPGLILVMQPRRLPTRLLAARVAWERGESPGQSVGYQIRMETVAGPHTKILFITEGILLRLLMADPRLQKVSAIIFDEFHERHLFGDISLAQAVRLQETHRPDLKIVVMSATLDGRQLEDYLSPCTILESSGRTFPVACEYLPREPKEQTPWDLAATVTAAQVDRTSGHILIFMPGAYEIHRTTQSLRGLLGNRFPIHALHGELPARDQDAAVAPSEHRKIIVSTNVAETSLTIDGITMVVDSGLARVARFDPQRGINSLMVEKISQASSEQRLGRAGRTAPGLCLRLWSESSHRQRSPRDVPEIHRVDLAETVLLLKALGYSDLSDFRWIDAPVPEALERAETLLSDLGALTSEGDITPLGRRMLSFPVHPRYARMLLAAEQYQCVAEVCTLAGLTQARRLFLSADRATENLRKETFGSGRSDFTALAEALRWAQARQFALNDCRRFAIHAGAAREAANHAEHFLKIARNQRLPLGNSPADESALAKCLLTGFADQVARRRSSGTFTCEVVHGRQATLAPDTVLENPKLLVAAEITEIGRSSDGKKRVQLGLLTEIEETWLEELFPGAIQLASEYTFDSSRNRVVERRTKFYRDLILETNERDADPSSETSAILAREVLAGRIGFNEWSEAVEQWVHRVNFLSATMPEWEIPPINQEARELLVQQLCEGAVAYKEIKHRPVLGTLHSWLNSSQRQLVDQYAPERIELPSGRKAKVLYQGTAAPTVSARIQELYGSQGEFQIAQGRVTLTIQVLAPNYRPVQITKNLTNFWREAYPQVKRQLQRQYPKHEWRETPF